MKEELTSRLVVGSNQAEAKTTLKNLSEKRDHKHFRNTDATKLTWT